MDEEEPSTSAPQQLHEAPLRRGAYVTPNVCDDEDKVQRLDKCILIEYPGHVKNKWHAVQRLGGLAAIVEVRLSFTRTSDNEMMPAERQAESQASTVQSHRHGCAIRRSSNCENGTMSR